MKIMIARKRKSIPLCKTCHDDMHHNRPTSMDKETGEPDDATSIPSGSEGGWEKRPVMDLARSLPNLETNCA